MVNAEEIQIIWINNSNNKQRKENMLNILSKYFPNNKHHHVEAIIHSPKYQGITMAHIVALLKGIDSNSDVVEEWAKQRDSLLKNKSLNLSSRMTRA